ncbi:putative quinol monooxygenase [Klebsiella pneumoniae]|uniref:putative quinol monooxygenase n=1 Tax=Klebsiella oxytoca TaxID=571 RepID=UPI0018C50E55|nr:putative quinol monooxygenase [Klebsiella oxytoca]MBG2708985.1 antibiotic biosynthesis monooxygenase [Klebsiella oxytoca]
MITAIVKAFIRNGKQEELRRIADILQHEYSVKEDGCIQYESYIDGATFVTLERWSDQASLDKHLAQDHVKKYVPLMRECVENGTFDVLFINGGEIEAVTI